VTEVFSKPLGGDGHDDQTGAKQHPRRKRFTENVNAKKHGAQNRRWCSMGGLRQPCEVSASLSSHEQGS